MKLNRTAVMVVILVIICVIGTCALLIGFKGIRYLVEAGIYLFFGLLAYVFLFGGKAQYIIGRGVFSLDWMSGHFFELSAYTDSNRTSYFLQNWRTYWKV